MRPETPGRADALLNPLLRTFRCVAARGSFHRAAPELFLSATAVRKQVNQLEDELGVALFERTRRGLAPTAAGAAQL